MTPNGLTDGPRTGLDIVPFRSAKKRGQSWMSRGEWHFPELVVWQFDRLQLIVTAPLDAVGTTLPDTGDVGVIEAGGGWVKPLARRWLYETA